MAKVKLELQMQNDQQLRELATAHKLALSTAPGNAQFPTPAPAPAEFDAALAGYGAKLDEITLAEAHLGSLRSAKEQLRTALEELLTQRGAYVQAASLGDPVKIQNAGLSIQNEATPTSSLEKPQNLTATTGLNDGEIKLTCKAVAKAKSYLWECRVHEDNAAPGPWTQVKVGTKASIVATGLTSGRKYAFRVRAVGPNDILSPWSDEAVAMAG